MKRTAAFVLMALGMLSLHRLAPVWAPQKAEAAAVEQSIGRNSGPKLSSSMRLADDSSSDDSGDSDDPGSGDSQ